MRPAWPQMARYSHSRSRCTPAALRLGPRRLSTSSHRHLGTDKHRAALRGAGGTWAVDMMGACPHDPLVRTPLSPVSRRICLVLGMAAQS